MNWIILSDFDGTIVTVDTAEYVLRKFAQGDWRVIEVQFESGEISLEECMTRQFEMVRVPEQVILDELDRIISLRSNFGKLVEHCGTFDVPLIVVSAGLDFWIRHFLERNRLSFLELYAPKAECTNDGIRLSFPTLRDAASANFKEDTVRYCKRQGRKVLYIGNGDSDYPAAKKADFTFAINDSRLAMLCSKNGIPHKQMIDFSEVIEFVENA